MKYIMVINGISGTTEFGNVETARKELKCLVDGQLTHARIYDKEATKIRVDKNTYQITRTRNPKSSIIGTYGIKGI